MLLTAEIAPKKACFLHVIVFIYQQIPNDRQSGGQVSGSDGSASLAGNTKIIKQ